MSFKSKEIVVILVPFNPCGRVVSYVCIEFCSIEITATFLISKIVNLHTACPMPAVATPK